MNWSTNDTSANAYVRIFISKLTLYVHKVQNLVYGVK